MQSANDACKRFLVERKFVSVWTNTARLGGDDGDLKFQKWEIRCGLHAPLLVMTSPMRERHHCHVGKGNCFRIGTWFLSWGGRQFLSRDQKGSIGKGRSSWREGSIGKGKVLRRLLVYFEESKVSNLKDPGCRVCRLPPKTSNSYASNTLKYAKTPNTYAGVLGRFEHTKNLLPKYVNSTTA